MRAGERDERRRRRSGAGRGAQKEAQDKVTRMDEGSERKWNRWRRGRREECAGEHVNGKKEREREGSKAEKEPPPAEGGDGGGRGGPRSQRGDLEEWKE